MIKLTVRVFIVSLLVMAAMAIPAHAALPPQLSQFAVCGGSSPLVGLGLEPWYACVQDGSGRIVIDNLNDVWLIVLVVLEDAIKLSGYVAAGFLFWGGFKYIKSNGEPGQAAQGRDIMRNALIGLFIVMIAVAIVEFIYGTLT